MEGVFIVNEAIFKAYDVRGRVGTELNAEVCELIGRAFADWLPESGVVAVGRDMRPDSAELAAALINGLRLQGRDVWDIGEVTSDMIYFAVGNFNLAGGAMVTASHNPGEYNGIKLCREQARPIGIETGLAEIRNAAKADIFAPAAEQGSVTEKDVRVDWIQHALSFVTPEDWPKYRVVIDAGNGMAGAIIPAMEQFVPLVITPMYFDLDGTFPNHIANPLVPENIKDIQAKIAEEKSDFGIAFDGDGDRAVLIDEKGQSLSGTVMTAILAKYFLEKNPGATVLYNAICGRIVPETAEKNGGKSQRTKVGHSFIKAEMRTRDAIFAGEHSGHYYFRDNYYADSGLIAAVVAIQALSDSGKKLSELGDEFRVYPTITETNFEVENKDEVLERVKKEFTNGDQDDLDGLTVNYPTMWFNLRASNTEPVMRLNAEAETEAELSDLVNRVKKVIQK